MLRVAATIKIAQLNTYTVILKIVSDSF